jgi:NADH-quinone oxidoreductase subunit J
MMVDIIFVIAAVLALGSALGMVLVRNAVHSALLLVTVQVALAILFLLQGAFFVAMLQVIIYAGAIMVLFVFVIMLLGVDRREVLIEPLLGQRALGIGLGAALLALGVYVVVQGGLRVSTAAASGPVGTEGNVEAVARVLFTDWAFPFEVTSILLVVAIAGVMVLARKKA